MQYRHTSHPRLSSTSALRTLDHWFTQLKSSRAMRGFMPCASDMPYVSVCPASDAKHAAKCVTVVKFYHRFIKMYHYRGILIFWSFQNGSDHEAAKKCAETTFPHEKINSGRTHPQNPIFPGFEWGAQLMPKCVTVVKFELPRLQSVKLSSILTCLGTKVCVTVVKFLWSMCKNIELSSNSCAIAHGKLVWQPLQFFKTGS